MEIVSAEITASKRREARTAEVPILWRHADNSLYANVQDKTDPPRFSLVVEQLPRRNGWDWTVWRPGKPDETSRHGRASSAVSAMAAAEAAARHWEVASRGQAGVE